MSGKRDKKLRKAMRVEAKLILAKDPRSGLSFAVNSVPVDVVPQVQQPAEPPLSPEEKELTKLYKTFATTVWRMRNVLLDTETGEPKEFSCFAPSEEMGQRNISKLAKYLESLDGALEDAHVQIKGDYVGTHYDEGDAVKVITFEDRQDLAHDEYIEILTPTVRWTDKDGKARLLQQAEVVVGKSTQK